MKSALTVIPLIIYLSLCAGCDADTSNAEAPSLTAANNAPNNASKPAGTTPQSSASSAPRTNPSPGTGSASTSAVSTSPSNNIWVTEHNKYRRQKGLDGLNWSAEIAAVAQEWATKLVTDSCGAIEHRPESERLPLELGENIALAQANPAPPTHGADFAVKKWADEELFYDYGANSCQPGKVCGHYTQVVWRGSKEVGCGEATCTDGQWNTKVWVCNYRPAGNMMGEKPY